MGAESKRWSVLDQRWWGASPVLEDCERLNHLPGLCCRRPLKMQWFHHEPKHQNPPKNHWCLPASQQTSVQDAHLGLFFPWAANQLSIGWRGNCSSSL